MTHNLKAFITITFIYFFITYQGLKARDMDEDYTVGKH